MRNSVEALRATRHEEDRRGVRYSVNNLSDNMFNEMFTFNFLGFNQRYVSLVIVPAKTLNAPF